MSAARSVSVELTGSNHSSNAERRNVLNIKHSPALARPLQGPAHESVWLVFAKEHN
jgi:hypothetical protein